MPKKIRPVPQRVNAMDSTLEAFKLASPFAMAMRTDNFAHCVEASVVGTIALRSFGVNVTATPCSVFGSNLQLNPPMQIALGLTRRDMYSRLTWAEGTKMSFEEWSEANTDGLRDVDGDTAMHMAIVATAPGRRIIVDPTIGQLNTIHPIAIHLAEYLECFPGQRWPVFDTSDGWELAYGDSPHDLATKRHAEAYKIQEGWVADLTDLMKLAKSCALDPNRFLDELEKQDAVNLEIASTRIMQLLKPMK